MKQVNSRSFSDGNFRQESPADCRPWRERTTAAVWLAWAALISISACAGLITPGAARAQISDDYVTPQRDFRSPESFAFELRIGPYVPDVGTNAFNKAYPGDHGLLLGLELDYVVFRLPEILYLGPAFGFSYANYSGKAINRDTDARSTEKADFTLIPLSLLGVARVDVLARKLGIPLIFAAKFGYRWNIWDSDKGGADEDNGVSPSWTWALQGDLDLDFFDRRAARLLDEEWGINHSYLFFEVFGVKTTGSGLKVDDTTWTAGIGFII